MIKNRISELKSEIKRIELEIKELQENCEHIPIDGYYSWRIGNMQPAILCSECGKLLKVKDIPPPPTPPPTRFLREGEEPPRPKNYGKYS
jgi:hypothetical protein